MCQIRHVLQRVFSPKAAKRVCARIVALLAACTLYCGVPAVFGGNEASAESFPQKSPSNQSITGFTVKDCSFRLWSKNQDIVFEYERIIDRAQVLSHSYDAETQVLALQFNCPARIKAKAFRTGLAKFPQIGVSSSGKQFTISIVTASEQESKRPTEPTIEIQNISIHRLRVVLTPGVDSTRPPATSRQESPLATVSQATPKVSEPDASTPNVGKEAEEGSKEAADLRSEESENLTEKRPTEKRDVVKSTPNSAQSKMVGKKADQSTSREQTSVEDPSTASQESAADTDSSTEEIDAAHGQPRHFEQEAVRLPQPEVLDQSNSERLGVPLEDSALVDENKKNEDTLRKSSAQKGEENPQRKVLDDTRLPEAEQIKERSEETLTVAKQTTREDSIEAESKPERTTLQERKEQRVLREREEAQRALAELRRTANTKSASYQQISEHGPIIALFAGLFFVCGTIMLLWYRSRVYGRNRERARLYAEEVALRQDLSECYSLLGVRRTDSIEVIKKRYKHLVKVFHVDRLVSESLPEEMRSLANERFQQIQEAYEKIRERRGF